MQQLCGVEHVSDGASQQLTQHARFHINEHSTRTQRPDGVAEKERRWRRRASVNVDEQGAQRLVEAAAFRLRSVLTYRHLPEAATKLVQQKRERGEEERAQSDLRA